MYGCLITAATVSETTSATLGTLGLDDRDNGNGDGIELDIIVSKRDSGEHTMPL